MIIVRKLFSIIFNVAGWALIIYFILAIIISSASAIKQPAVTLETQNKINKINYYGNGQAGPDKVALVEGTMDAYNARIALIRSANENIDFVCHTICNGESSDAFFAELENAAMRGVKVRILLDGKTGPTGKQQEQGLAQLQSHPNIEYKMYNQAETLKPWSWHFLLHDKFLIVDNKYMLLGGRNIGDKYYNPNNFSGEVVDDRDVFVCKNIPDANNSVLDEINLYMEELWNLPCVEYPVISKSRQKQIDKTKIDLQQIANNFEKQNPEFYKNDINYYIERSVSSNKVSLIHNPVKPSIKEPVIAYQIGTLTTDAKESILLQTPYATGNKKLLQAIQNSGENAEFKMVINSLASSPNFPAYSNYYTQRKKFINAGAKIYEYQSKDSIHGKSILIDDEISIVGSLNMDDRSFYLDTETMLVIDSPEFAQSLKNAMESFQNQALLVGENNKYIESDFINPAPIPFFKKPLMYITSIFSRLFQFII